MFFQITDLIHSRAAFWPVNSLRGALAHTLATASPRAWRCLDSRPNKLVHVRIPLKKLNVRFMQAERARTMTGWLRRFMEAHGFCVYRRRTSEEESIGPRSEFEYIVINRRLLRRLFAFDNGNQFPPPIHRKRHNRCYWGIHSDGNHYGGGRKEAFSMLFLLLFLDPSNHEIILLK